LPSARRDGAELHWEALGSGPPLVMGAGLGGTGDWWAPNVEALSRRFTVYRFDQRGTGLSSRVPVESVDQMALDLLAVLDDAKLPVVRYIGHSTGAAIGVAALLRAPERFRSLVIYASTTHGDPYRRKVLGLRSALLEGLGPGPYAEYTSLLLYPPYWINQNAGLLAQMEAKAAGNLGSPEVQASRFRAILEWDIREKLHGIGVPTLVVCADDDILTPRYFSEEFARRIPGAQTYWAVRGGHALSRTEPEQFNTVVMDFLQRS